MSTKFDRKAIASLTLRKSGLLELYKLQDSILIAVDSPYYALLDRDEHMFHILFIDPAEHRNEWLGSIKLKIKGKEEVEAEELLKEFKEKNNLKTKRIL